MNGVAVIIGAYEAQATIARAVVSALAQPETTEVIVVDDASIDNSAVAAAQVDDGSGRLTIIRQQRNRGPAAARNLAIAASSSPYIAVLDADDFLLPGRFASLLAEPDWDLIADNIAFVPEEAAGYFAPAALPERPEEVGSVDLAGFVERNISSRDAPRGELGFLKPVMRRTFLDRHGLAYDEALRLGEDYALYCRALAAGARFRLSRRCGYVAIERANSLSGRHRTEDLFALAASDNDLLARSGLSPAERALLRRHRDQVMAKAHHRRFLDDRREHGLARAALSFIDRPLAFLRVARDVGIDKLASRRPAPPASPRTLRYLFD